MHVLAGVVEAKKICLDNFKIHFINVGPIMHMNEKSDEIQIMHRKTICITERKQTMALYCDICNF